MDEPSEYTEDLKIETDIEYEIVYIDESRLTGYYVLINPIDISNNNFKTDIKELVRAFVKEKGNRIWLDIYDNDLALEYGYIHDTGDIEDFESIIKDDDKLKLLARHSIAYFNGEQGELIFFSWSDRVAKSPVNKYFELIEFNP